MVAEEKEKRVSSVVELQKIGERLVFNFHPDEDEKNLLDFCSGQTKAYTVLKM